MDAPRWAWFDSTVARFEACFEPAETQTQAALLAAKREELLRFVAAARRASGRYPGHLLAWRSGSVANCFGRVAGSIPAASFIEDDAMSVIDDFLAEHRLPIVECDGYLFDADQKKVDWSELVAFVNAYARVAQ